MKQIIFIFTFLMLGVVAQAQTQTPSKTKCTAITTKGVQCKNTAVPGKPTCSIHDADAPRCGALTTKGLPCKMRVKKQGELCFRHRQ